MLVKIKLTRANKIRLDYPYLQTLLSKSELALKYDDTNKYKMCSKNYLRIADFHSSGVTTNNERTKKVCRNSNFLLSSLISLASIFFNCV